jgi:hypothetical protein
MHRVLAACVLLSFTAFLGWAKGEEDPESKGRQVIVSIYNDAGVPGSILVGAERRAGSIFARANFEVAWVNCTSASESDPACMQTNFPGHLALRIIPGRARSMSNTALGVAFLSRDGAGKYCDVFWQRAEDLHGASNLDVSSILGSVMAHEMGHLLIGSNAHAISGIMRAHWGVEELRRIATGTLWFTAQQAELMYGKARLADCAEDSVSVKPPNGRVQALR